MDYQTQEILGMLGRADHYQVLLTFPLDLLHLGHPLRHPTNVLLRELAVVEGLDAVGEFLDRRESRAAALRRMLALLLGTDFGALSDHGIERYVVCTTPGAAVDAALRVAPGAQGGQVADDGAVVWVDRSSFGVMVPGARHTYGGRSFVAVAERCASTIGRAHYAFTLPNQISYYQPASIRVTAAVWDWLSRQTALPGLGLTPWEQEGIDRLRRIPADALGGREQQMLAMTLAYELAQRYEIDGSAPVLEMLARAGHDPGDAFSPGFLGPEDYGGWERLNAGGGTPSRNTSDMTLVMRDVLAAVTLATVRPDDVSTEVLAAFLWQLVAPRRPKEAPRGLIAALRAAERLDLPGLLADIERVFAAGRTAPDTVPRLMIAMELRSGALLHERFPHAVPDPTFMS